MRKHRQLRWLASSVLIAVALLLLGMNDRTPAGAAESLTLNVYIDGDTNIFDLWSKSLLPAFAKRYPQYRANMVPLLHGNGSQGVFDKILAAKRAGKPTDVDLWETEPSFVQQGISEVLWVRLNERILPNITRVPQGALEAVDWYGVPYRGSSVVIGYNSAFVKNPPKTFDDLVAWIKANPGKFTYCDPNTGGSGQAFVASAIYKFAQATKFAGNAYDPKEEAAWAPAWKLLKDLQPTMYNNGFHPNGNVAVLQLLAQQNIWIAPVWSDMGLDFSRRGQLPKSVKFEQLTPPLFGGDSTVTLPAGADSKHLEGTLTLLNWLLTPEAQALVIKEVSGYPGIDWKYMPASVRATFQDVAKPYAPFPNAKYLADLKRLWHEQVAGQ
ncbi:MAG TPA: extracellular solute-binding protein [bacterium]|nr:extracellular solute-binding protein [bacterium]